MQYIDLTAITAKEIIPGFSGKFIHAERTTTVYWDIVADSILPEHAHEHEQIMNVIEGEFEIEIEGKSLKLYSDDVVVIPSHVPHSGKAITHCKIIDIFSPAREDYKI